MMKISLIVLWFIIGDKALAQNLSNSVITTDIENFWMAYDQIITATDSSKKYEILDRCFIAKGSPGLKAMMIARSYTNKSYLDAIIAYPFYWNSIRNSMLKAQKYSKKIDENVGKLRKIYPSLKPAKIYFTVGAFKSGGTTLDSLVLIGSEISMADRNTDIKEFEKKQPSLASYLKTYPVDILVFTTIHEYVHTQQKTTEAPNLLGQCVLEGVAEFIAEKVTEQYSTAPAINYGERNRKRVEAVFSSAMFNTSNDFWLYSNKDNEFRQRDLGYYVGYAICEAYYEKSSNKAVAIKEMIELDYSNKELLIDFVERSGYFAESVGNLARKHEAGRPTVLSTKPDVNNRLISKSVTKITVNFSEPMDRGYQSFEFGPLGKEGMLSVKKILGFSDNGKTFTFEVELDSDKHYQLIVGAGFRNLKGVELKPYLIDFSTM